MSRSQPQQQYQSSYNQPSFSSYQPQQPRLISPEIIPQPRPSLRMSFESISPSSNRSFLAPLCLGQPPRTNIQHPSDSGKYIACLTETTYEIMDCPNGLVYNAGTDQCEKSLNKETICERDQPCMNEGQCHQTSPTTYKCTCRGAWTGERCETPLSSCAADPCGPGNQCHTLRASDYKQDFVCICDVGQSYGLTCGRSICSIQP